uniref:SH3 domain-containing protein n=1 Tax=Lutzomyia longipalpis TaxID=7200 RepID=A0A1B0GKF1_LUTLO
IISVVGRDEPEWWRGELNGIQGLFPSNYVGPFVTSDKVIALYPYKAQNDDELSFEKDDIISVVGRDEPEWWRGELNGIQGLFPSNYVGPFVTSGNV